MELTVDSAINGAIGGVLIGTAVTLLLLVHGRIAGISGIVAGLLGAAGGEFSWRFAFILGLLAGGVLLLVAYPESLPRAMAAPRAQLVVGGLLVGFGSRMGSGCTSGHGVCGLSRLSPRSLSAVVTFTCTGVISVALLRAIGGGP